MIRGKVIQSETKLDSKYFWIPEYYDPGIQEYMYNVVRKPALCAVLVLSNRLNMAFCINISEIVYCPIYLFER